MIAGMRAGDPAGNVEASAVFVRVYPEDPRRRILTCTPERTSDVYYHWMIDNAQVGLTTDTELLLDQGDNDARVAIEVIETSEQNWDETLLHVSTTPDDRGLCTWDETTGVTQYKLYRKVKVGGTYELIYTVDAGGDSYSYTDGPLDDETYTYKLVALDEEGDTSDEEEDITISSTPEPPSAITYSWNSGTHILTVGWTASPSF